MTGFSVDTAVYMLFAVALLPLFLAPGGLWLRRCGVDPMLAAYGGFAATALAMGLVVAVGLLLPWGVGTTCVGGFVLMLAVSMWCAFTAPRPLLPERADLTGLAVFAAAFLSLAAFTAAPSRPSGFWDNSTVGPNRIDTPRWPGLTTDNLLPYRTGQIAFHKLGGEEARDKYATGWWVSDRTPLTGLAFTFTAGVFGVRVPKDDPTLRPQQMAVKDSYGFWAYQLVGMFFNLAFVLGVFLLARVWLDARVARVAVALAALLPGVFLHSIYTRPVLGVGYCVLVALALVVRNRAVLAGAAAGCGILIHPSGLVWAVAVGIGLIAYSASGGRMRAARRFAVPVVVLLLPWLIFTSGVMNAQSRLTTTPLNYYSGDPRTPGKNWEVAWQAYKQDGVLKNVWDRLVSLTRGVSLTSGVSPAPLTGDLGRTVDQAGVAVATPDGSYSASLRRSWLGVHGSSIWGMAGLSLFLVALVSVVRRWPDDRRLWVGFALPGVVLAFLVSGEPFSLGYLTFQPLLGPLALAGACGLLALRPGWRFIVIALMAFEFATVVYACLYAPFAIGTGARVALLAVALAGHLTLFGLLTRWSGLSLPRLPRRLARTAPAGDAA